MKQLVILVSILLILTKSEKCYVIAFQDGGDAIPYQAGAFQGITQNLLSEDQQYNVTTGVGFGGLQAAVIASYKQGFENQASERLVKLWEDLTHADIYGPWLGGNIWGELYSQGMFSTGIWRSFIDDLNISEHHRHLLIGATNIDTGEYERWDESVTGEEFNNAFMASTALPVLFPFVHHKGQTYISGSTSRSLDLSAGIKKCKDLGYKEKDIVADAVFSTQDTDLPEWNEKQKFFNTYRRQTQFLETAQYNKDYALTKAKYPEVTYRCAIQPSVGLPGSNYPFTYTTSVRKDIIEQGRVDAGSMCDGSSAQKIEFDYHAKKLELNGKKVTDELVAQEIQKWRRRFSTNEQVIQQQQE